MKLDILVKKYEFEKKKNQSWMDESFLIRSITYIYKIDLFNADFKLIDYHDQLLNVPNNITVKQILHY